MVRWRFHEGVLGEFSTSTSCEDVGGGRRVMGGLEVEGGGRRRGGG